MKIKNKKFLTVLLIFTLCLTLFATAAQAAELPSFELPVTVSLDGTLPSVDEDFTIVLKADNPAYPMPKGSENGVFSMIITGANTVKMPVIEYSSVGIYTYTIFQEANTNEDCSYDSIVYNLVVYVTNAEEGSGLEITVLLYQLGETDKLSEVVFHNEYDVTVVAGDTDEQPGPADDTDTVVKSASDQPKTDDEALIWPYVVLFISAVGLLLILGFSMNKRKTNG